MKNHLKQQEDHTGLIVGIAVGVALGIGLGWLFLTDQGAKYRRQISRRFKAEASDKTSDVISNKTIISKKLAKEGTDAVIMHKL